MKFDVKDGRNGHAAPIDWIALKTEILSKLDVAAEYRALGVEFTSDRPNGKGILECHAIGRKDEVPSAMVNVRTGIYHDSGGSGESLNLWDFALKHGEGFGRHVEVVRHYGEKAGVEVLTPHYHSGGRIREAEYLYRAADGTVRYAVFRYRLPTGKKTFTQHPPDGKGGWRFGSGAMDGVEPLPYRLPELLANPEEPLWIVEGEKDVERLRTEGLYATTNHQGAQSTDRTWPKFLDYFRGRICHIIPDNDPGGLIHARKIAAYLHDVAQVVKLLELPGLPAKGDVSDWLDAGGTIDELGRIAHAAPVWDPAAEGLVRLEPSRNGHHESNGATPHAGPSEEEWGEPILDATIPAVPFPVEVLPANLADLVIESADCLNCPTDYLGVAALAVASGAIGRSVALVLKEGWIESPSLFAAIVGDPGMTKSPALGATSKPLWGITDDLIRRHKLDAARARENDDEPPPLARIAVDDTTVEALAPILRDNPRGLIMVRDELTAWVSGLNQYKNGKGADRQFFLSAWSGSPVVVDRKRNEGIPILIPRPFLSVLGALTPGMLTELSEAKSRDDGFLDRLLFALPDPVQVRWRPDGIHPELAQEWDQAVRRLWWRSMVADGDRLRPFMVRFTPDGSRAFGEWFNAHCQETEGADFPSHLKGAWAKFRAYCGRLALIVELLRLAYDPTDDDRIPEVGPMAVADAALLIDYFKNHARRVRALLRGAGTENDDARALLDWCRRTSRRTFSEREAKRNFQSRFAGDNQALATALDWLKVRRCIRPVDPGPARPGRPSSPSFEVNPALTRDKEPGPD